MARNTICSIDVCRAAFCMERDEVEWRSFATGGVVLAVDCVVEKETEPVAVWPTCDFGSADCSAG